MRARDIVQVYVKKQLETRGKWSAPKILLSYDNFSGTVTVLGRTEARMKAAIEDVKMASPENFLAGSLQEGIAVSNNSIESCIDELCVESISFNGGPAEGQSVAQTVGDRGLDSYDDEDIFISLPSVRYEIELY